MTKRKRLYKKTGFDKSIVKGSLEVSTSLPLNIKEIEQYLNGLNSKGHQSAYLISQSKYKSILNASKQFYAKKSAHYQEFYLPLQIAYICYFKTNFKQRSLTEQQYLIITLILVYCEVKNIQTFYLPDVKKFASSFGLNMPTIFKKLVTKNYLIRISSTYYKLGPESYGLKIETGRTMSKFYNKYIDNFDSYFENQ